MELLLVKGASLFGISVTLVACSPWDLRKPGSSHQENEDENGVRIITLAGSNIGASMRGELDEKAGPHKVSLGEPDALGAYVNSNFQAVNNSIMLGGSYSSNDPGVHMDISDLVEQGGIKPEKPGRKGKKKEKDNAKSDQKKEKENAKSYGSTEGSGNSQPVTINSNNVE
ncbi:hypothetical protein RJ641_026926 [Dillenia turbinata]|uniref:Uncharacterized protein n=1 Tax=Dillenia turbinata TaxID=194707 RepID=A0AAN8ZHQ9_9MAGN